MKNIILASLIATPLFADAQELPQPSPLGRVEQVIGLTTVKVQYSRPNVRGRAIFGDLVPTEKVWRTGANKCTTFETDGTILVQGEKLGKGIYSLFTIPNEGSWVIIFNSDTALWGEEDRKDSADVLRVKVPSTRQQELVETFTIGFEAVKDDHARMDLSWEHTRASIDLYADATDQGLRNIETALADPKAGFGAYNGAARFCLDRKVKVAKALEWAQKSTSLERKYWNTHILARALAANGKMKEAITAAEESMRLAEAANAPAYVKMNKERISEWSAGK